MTHSVPWKSSQGSSIQQREQIMILFLCHTSPKGEISSTWFGSRLDARQQIHKGGSEEETGSYLVSMDGSRYLDRSLVLHAMTMMMYCRLRYNSESKNHEKKITIIFYRVSRCQ